MGRQITLFWVAVQFLTRLPTPAVRGFQPDWMARSARYFPLVGMGVGAVCTAVLLAADQVWSGLLPALVAVGFGVLITGAFHEDGLADAFDGLGGGQTRERRLEIMKDSRIGVFGVLALGLTMAIKIASIAQTPVFIAALGLLAAHGAGRAAAVFVMGALPYSGDREWAKVKPIADGVTRAEIAIAAVLGALALVPLLLVAPLATAVALAAGALCATAMALVAARLIGGWVGDTLGATEQMFEVGFLSGLAAAVVLI